MLVDTSPVAKPFQLMFGKINIPVTPGQSCPDVPWASFNGQAPNEVRWYPTNCHVDVELIRYLGSIPTGPASSSTDPTGMNLIVVDRVMLCIGSSTQNTTLFRKLKHPSLLT